MMNRFGDIDASCKRLQPIIGYHTEKLVSIEKALEPVEPFINELSRFIQIAKKNCHFPSEHGLSKDESAAVYIYTMDWGDTALYRVLNKALRSENRQVLKIWLPYLKLFDTALDKLPTVKQIVWRGVSIDISKNFIKNQFVTWWSINSCSSSVDVIKNIFGNNKNSTLFSIEAVNGKNISGYAQYENEHETILKMGTQFRVTNNTLEQSNGSHVVHLIEVNVNDDDESLASTTNEMRRASIASHQERLASTTNEIRRASVPSNQQLLTSTTNEMRRASVASNQEPLTSSTNEMRRASTASNQGASGQITSSQINMKTKWQQYGTTVAGGNRPGKQLNQLASPYGIYIDDDNQCIYIADCDNHRVVAWKYNAETGEVVAGGNGYGNRMDQLNGPTGVIVDQKNDSLIICDLGNRRVVRWPRYNGKNGQIIISDIDCYNLTMDNNGDLYVSDFEKHEVRRWKIGEKSGTIVAGGNGKGNNLNQLNEPTFIFVDQDYSIYISDSGNHRVMKWLKDKKEGSIVAGGQGEGNSLTQISYPEGIFIDNFGHVYVADSYNHRIMRWSKGTKEGKIIVGGNGKGEQLNQFNLLRGLSFDRQGNLYVVDNSNNRVQKFNIDLN